MAKAKPDKERKDRETPWKELLEHETQRVIGYCWPDIHDETDWTRDWISLEEEFRPLAPQPAGKGRRVVDKLLRLHGKDGELRYLHIEVQARREKNFRWRIHTYNSVAEVRYGQPVASLPILIDDHPTWCPKGYRATASGTINIKTFRTFKVNELGKDMAGLFADPNPVGLFIYTFLESRRLDDADDEAVYQVKLPIVRRLREFGMTHLEFGRWLGMLDWLLQLPGEYNARIWREVHQQEKEAVVPLISYLEQVGEQRGLYKAIKLGLELKYGAEGLALMGQVEKIDSLTVLEAIYDAIMPATSLEDIRRLLPAASNGQH